MAYSIQNPWIKEREYAFCCWVPEIVRGEYFNHKANRILDILRASDEQIDRYVKMMGELGFTGIQILDNCAVWAACGSVDAAHGQLKKFIAAAKKYGQKVTVWVWAACFTDYGWHDGDADFNFTTPDVYDNPKYFRLFSRYYDKYAELAENADRLIFHFYDPGHLGDSKDVIRYVRLLESKCLARNPDLKFGVDTWDASEGYIDDLVNSGLDGHMLLELSLWMPDSEEKRRQYRKNAIGKGFSLGVWGWYTAEYETDQLASMNVNARVLKDVYNRIRSAADDITVPEYWSEMDATHVINLFSEYCAAQLLIDPDRDTDELLREISRKFLPDYENEIYGMLSLIQDARSGDRWETYWWRYPEHVFLTGNNRQSIYERAEKVEEFLIKIRGDHTLVSGLTLPYDPCDILDAVLPHIRQIKIFSAFRVEFDKLEAEADSLGKQELFSRLDALYKPVPAYNTWVGTFGPPEQRCQIILVDAFCKRYGIDFPYKAGLVSEIVHNALEKLYNHQRHSAEPYIVNIDFIYGEDCCLSDMLIASQCFEAIKKMGVIEVLPNNTFRLADWQNYSEKV